MKFLLLSMMFMFTLKECTLYTKHIKNYKPQKLSVDESFPKKSIKLIDKIKLEENEEVIISTINSIEILDGGLEFLIIDPSSKKTVVFNYMDGSIKNLILQEENWLRYFVAEKPHPISVAIKGKLKYINTDDYSKYDLNQNAVNYIKYSPFIIKSINKQHILLCHANMFAVSDEIKENSLDNRVFLLKYNSKLNLLKMVVPEVLHKSYILPSTFEILSNGNYIGSSSNYTYKDKGNIDSIVTVASYDSTGKFLGNIGYLPDKYVKNQLIYQERWQPLLTNINDSIFIAYPRDNDIYAPGQKIRFSLKNLPYSNDSGLVYLYDYYRLKKVENSRYDRFEVANLLPVSIIYTFNSNGNFGVVLLVFDKEHPMGYYYIAQEYDFKGNLLSHTKINDEPGNQIRNFVFDKYNNYLCIVSKNKDGWTLEKRKW
ncbi:MAG: hypothetical protein RO257_10365 [Candidatus Kapabacteria bacterium]|nr:hypothetical protein [Candidatus Kapabacteria bacterium]